MLSFRQIGLTSYKNYVDYQFLSTPSTSIVRRQKKKLKTFGETTAKKKQKINLAEKQRKLVQTCIKKTLAYSLVQGRQLQAGACQFLDLPRALADADGIPCKGVKANTTAVLARRYPGVIETSIDLMTPPDVVVLDGMFFVHSSPLKLPFMKTFQDYSRFLFCKWIVPYLKSAVTKEIHVVFDDPCTTGISPKSIERNRRDSTRIDKASEVIPIEDDIPLPQNWQTFIANRQQKRILINYVLTKLLHSDSADYLKNGQKLIVAGGFDGHMRGQAYSIIRQGVAGREPMLDSNHEEGDSRVWRHAFQSQGDTILIYSPDTDTYHIGLPLLEKYVNTHVIVQLSPSSASLPFSQSKFLLLNRLRQALHQDLDLADIDQESLTSVFQMLFITTGCDYISFFARLGKATFLNTLFQNASFITGSSMNDHGTLVDSDPSKSINAFYRLVGSAYFKKHRSAFQFSSPEQLFKDCAGRESYLTLTIYCFSMPSEIQFGLEFLLKMRCCHLLER